MQILFDYKKFKRFLAVIILLIFLSIIGFSSWGQFLFSRIINSSSTWLHRDIDREQKTRQELLEEIEILNQEIISREINESKIYLLEEENQKMRKFLNFFEGKSFNQVLANVVWQENFLNFPQYNQNIVIDRGSKDGLVEGLAVINDLGVVVGKIIKVEHNNSRVCLINNNFCKMAVSINNSQSTIGLAEGDLGLSVKINYVSQLEKVKKGDQILTSGLETNIPRGLLVARVTEIEQEVNDIWQNINAEALFDFTDLNIVAVLLPE